MRVEVRRAHPKRVRIRPIRRVVARLLETEGSGQAEVSILLTDDATVRELNAAYRRQDKPTDVLSFSLRERGSREPRIGSTQPGPPVLGDVVVSLDTAERQAMARSLDLDYEVAHLALHGTLHLLGYDDATEEGLAVMEQKAKMILADDPDHRSRAAGEGPGDRRK